MSGGAPAKILVIRGGAIGDFILTLPVLVALRQQFPRVRLEVLGYAHIASLALTSGLVDAVRSIEAGALAGFFARNGQLAPALSDYFGSCAIIVSYLYDPDGIFQTNVQRCSSAQFIPGPHRPDETKPEHATKVFLQPLQRLAIFDSDPVPRLDAASFRAAAVSVVKSADEAWLAIHPGSGSESKNWPQDHWLELVDLVVKTTPWRILLVGGEAEGERMDLLQGRLPADRSLVLRNSSLTALAGALGQCAAFVGHDSGISHLAAALGLPSVVLWGPSTEAIWRPPQGTIRILRGAGGLTTIPAQRVLTELRALIGRG